jgi:hypothetical protein
MDDRAHQRLERRRGGEVERPHQALHHGRGGVTFDDGLARVRLVVV